MSIFIQFDIPDFFLLNVSFQILSTIIKRYGDRGSPHRILLSETNLGPALPLTMTLKVVVAMHCQIEVIH